MSDYADDLFGDLADPGYYPGSKRKRSQPLPPKPKPTAGAGWDRNPRTITVGGKPVEFFTIGALAQALNRKPVTIRSWEAKGVLPLARYRTPAPPGAKDGRRLYTRRQVEGLIRLAAEHGILDFTARPDSIPKAFTTAAITLWSEPA